MNTHPPRDPDRKRAYHHGNLREVALRRGRELVVRDGPAALTLRGLARELGVTAAALVYHFGCIRSLRAAVAREALVEAGSERRHPDRPAARTIAEAWIDFATKNPNLYRLASGDGWLPARVPHDGRHGAGVGALSPRRTLQDMFQRLTRRLGRPKGEVELASVLAILVHGLALARVDGAPDSAVALALAAAVPS